MKSRDIQTTKNTHGASVKAVYSNSKVNFFVQTNINYYNT